MSEAILNFQFLITKIKICIRNKHSKNEVFPNIYIKSKSVLRVFPRTLNYLEGREMINEPLNYVNI